MVKLREQDKLIKTKEDKIYKQQDEIKKWKDQLIAYKKANNLGGDEEPLNIEDIKNKQVQAQEKIYEYQRVTQVLIKTKDQDQRVARMHKKMFEDTSAKQAEEIAKLNVIIKEKGKEIKMQALKIKEILQINSPDKKQQKIKQMYHELRDLSNPNFGFMKGISANPDNQIEMEKIRQIKIRYGGINLNHEKSYLDYLPTLDKAAKPKSVLIYDPELRKQRRQAGSALAGTPLREIPTEETQIKRAGSSLQRKETPKMKLHIPKDSQGENFSSYSVHTEEAGEKSVISKKGKTKFDSSPRRSSENQEE